jgi:phosphohistidine phosphatase
MQLYFLRHGRAFDPDMWRGDEPERPLMDEGRDELRRVARGLKWMGVMPDAIYTSPFTRAKETAEIVGAALGVGVTPAAELAPGCDLDRLTAMLATALTAGQPKSLLIVGHEPDLSTLVGMLIGRDGPARVEMKKASCARVDVSLTTGAALALAGCGTLAWLLRAKQLARIGG